MSNSEIVSRILYKNPNSFNLNRVKKPSKDLIKIVENRAWNSYQKGFYKNNKNEISDLRDESNKLDKSDKRKKENKNYRTRINDIQDLIQEKKRENDKLYKQLDRVRNAKSKYYDDFFFL